MKILAAGLSVRAMVESAVHSGYPVIALDAFGDSDVRALAETKSLHSDSHVRYSAKALFEAAAELDFDSIAYTSDLENHPEVLDQFGINHRIVGNLPKTIRSVRHWPALFSGLRQAGYHVPETIFPGTGSLPDPDRQWLVKPLLSGGGHGVSFWRGKMPADKPSMIQQYLPGKPCSASFVANGSECVVLGITGQLIGLNQVGAAGFRYCGNILPLPETLDAGKRDAILEQVRGVASFLTGEYRLTGVNGFDFILDKDQVWLTEVNPRYSASMELIEHAYRLSIFHLHVQACIDGGLPEFDLESHIHSGAFFGKCILFSQKDSTAPDTRDWLSWELRDIPATGADLPRGGPVCTMLAGGNSYDETLAGLIRKAGVLKELIYG